MAGSRTRYYTADEVRRIVMDVPDDSDISDFEGEDGDDASDMFEPSSDSDDSNVGRFAYKSFRLQVVSPTLRSIRLHYQSRFAYTQLRLKIDKY